MVRVEVKPVRLKDVRIIAKGNAKTTSAKVADSRAVICLYEPGRLEIGGERIRTIEEIPDVIFGCAVKVYDGACIVVNAFHVLLYAFSDGERGHIVSIPKEWLRMVGFWNLAEMGD